MNVVKSNHCAYNTHYHLVFPVKYRKSLFSDEVIQHIKEISVEISERYEITFERLGCDQDHIHVLCSFHPKYSIGETVRKYKSLTARELFKRLPRLRKDLWGGEFWSDGYYAATVGEGGSWKVVEEYIRKQGLKTEEVQLTLW